MTEDPQVPPENNTNSTTGDSWTEVGRQFQALGQSLADAVRVAWENEQTQARVREMRVGLESMANDIGKAVEDTANSPQGQQVRQEAEKAVESLRVAGSQTVQEVRPQLLSALEQLNMELQKLINRMQQTPPPAETSEPPTQNQGPTGPA